ncbi:MAG TPA: Spy/CpxP family protein refolding chaperone [Bacteroidota bacterium]|nr:Spy/CpxP family protein refolding chaperone [Bacteroidota bacterium]
MKSRMLFGVLVALLSVTFTLSAQPGMGMQMPMHQNVMDELKLTDQQKKDIEKIHSDAKKEQIDRFSEIAKAHVELQDLLKADNPSQSAIEKKSNDIGTLQNQARSKRLNVWFSINKLLTPEQQKVWKQTLQRHGQMRMGERMGRMGRMGMMRGGFQRNMNRPMRGMRMEMEE